MHMPMQDIIVTKKTQLVQVYSRNGFICRMSTWLGLFKREIGIKSNLPTILARQQVRKKINLFNAHINQNTLKQIF
jgi:hypothetical protein